MHHTKNLNWIVIGTFASMPMEVTLESSAARDVGA